MLSCGTALAQRIENAEADLIGLATRAAARRGASGVTIPVAGGLACFADTNSPMNKVVGLGFDGVPAARMLDVIVEGFAHPDGEGVPSHEEFRRRGVQAALLTHRLRVASEAGCDIAVVTAAPGSLSQKNVQRKGFDLLYTRAVLVRDNGDC